MHVEEAQAAGGSSLAAALDALLAQAPVGMGLIDREYRFVRINPVLAEMNGLPASEQIGRKVGEVVPDVWPAVKPLYDRVLNDGEVVTAEVNGRTPADPGVDHTWTATYYPVRERGTIIGLGALIVDITTQRSAERTAAERARKQAVVAELGTLGLSLDGARLGELLDEAARLTAEVLGVEYAGVGEVLPGGDELVVRAAYGWPQADVRDRRLRTEDEGDLAMALSVLEPIVIADTRAEKRFAVPPALRSEGVRSGIAVPILVGAQPWGVLAAHSTEPGRFGTNDVDFVRSVANLLSDAATRASAERQGLLYEAVLQGMREGVALVRIDEELEDAYFVFVNDAYARMLGYEARELIGTRIMRTIAAAPVYEVAATLDADGVWTGEALRLTKAGEKRRFLASAIAVDHTEFGGLRIEVATDVTEARELERARARLEEQRRRLLAQLVRAQEDERRRIAGDIHDDTLQVLSAVRLRLDLLRRDAPAHAEAIGRIEEDVAAAARSLRSLLFELRPPSLIDAGLEAGLADLLAELCRRGGPATRLTAEIRSLPLELRTICFRLAREAILNAEVHAGADEIRVELTEADGDVLIRVSDDGCGFDTEAQANSGHIGLITMRERAELAGGSARIASVPDRGTTVELRVPIDPRPPLADRPGVANVS